MLPQSAEQQPQANQQHISSPTFKRSSLPSLRHSLAMDPFTPCVSAYANRLPPWHHGGHLDPPLHDDSGYASEDADLVPSPSLTPDNIHSDTDHGRHNIPQTRRRHRAAAFVIAQWVRPAPRQHPCDPFHNGWRTYALPQPLPFEQQRNSYRFRSRPEPTTSLTITIPVANLATRARGGMSRRSYRDWTVKNTTLASQRLCRRSATASKARRTTPPILRVQTVVHPSNRERHNASLQLNAPVLATEPKDRCAHQHGANANTTRRPVRHSSQPRGSSSIRSARSSSWRGGRWTRRKGVCFEGRNGVDKEWPWIKKTVLLVVTVMKFNESC